MNKFIIIEGPDFCGKSTQIDLLDTDGYYANPNVFFTREPGSYLPDSLEVCESIRQEILFNDHTVQEEAELFAKSRYFHTKEIVELMTNYNDVFVISDRYIISSLAYQGFAQNLGADFIYEVNKPSLDLLREHNIKLECIKFEIDEATWLERQSARLKQENADSIEQKNIHKDILKFFSDDNIFNYYTKFLNMNIYRIDASRDRYAVYSDFKNTIDTIINN